MSGDEKTTVTQLSSRRKAAVLSVWRESTASEGRSPPRAPWNWWSGAPVRHSGFPHNDRALDRPLWMSDVIPETTFIWRRRQRHRQLGHSRELKLAACNRFHELGMLPVGSFETAEAKRPPWGSGAPPDLTAKLAICGGSRGAWSAADTCGCFQSKNKRTRTR